MSQYGQCRPVGPAGTAGRKGPDSVLMPEDPARWPGENPGENPTLINTRRSRGQKARRPRGLVSLERRESSRHGTHRTQLSPPSVSLESTD